MTGPTQDPRNSPENFATGPKYEWAFWMLAVFAFIGLLVARIVFPSEIWQTFLAGLLLVSSLTVLTLMHRTRIKARIMAYSLNSLVTTLLVIGIVGVLNFLAVRYSKKFDLTSNSIHTLTEQSQKVTKGLTAPVEAVFFGQIEQSENVRPLLNRYKTLSHQFRVEYVDPNKEVTRAQAAGIRSAAGVLNLTYGERHENIESPTEEKITNALLKLTSLRKIVVCELTGHGEAALTDSTAMGYEAIRRLLVRQTYETRAIDLRTDGKVPADCSVLVVNGPTRGFLPAEVTALRDYLDQGGHAYIALGLNLQAGGTEASPELAGILSEWRIASPLALVIDPLSAQNRLDPSIPKASSYADHPITRAFRETQDPAKRGTIFPLTRFFQILPNPPATLKIAGLAESTPNAWAETDLAALLKQRVSFDAQKDFRGPLFLSLVIEGKKDPAAKRDSRLVLVGTNLYANNQYARLGNNADFFANAIGWLSEDESTLTIRERTDAGGLVNLSPQAAAMIGLFAIFVVPFLIAVSGFVVWVLRRRM